VGGGPGATNAAGGKSRAEKRRKGVRGQDRGLDSQGSEAVGNERVGGGPLCAVCCRRQEMEYVESGVYSG
jgi:hypothetical protein